MKKVLTILFLITFICLSSFPYGLTERSETTSLVLNQYGSSSMNIFKVANGPSAKNLDPLYVTQDSEKRIVDNLFEGLFMVDPLTGEIEKDLVSRWSVDDNNLMTLTLRDISWSDGKPITTDDVAFSWSRISTLSPVYNQYIEDVSSLDQKTFTIKVKEGLYTSKVLEVLATRLFYVVPSHAVQKDPLNWAKDENIITGGKFQVEVWSSELLVLTPSSNMYGVNYDAVAYYSDYDAEDLDGFDWIAQGDWVVGEKSNKKVYGIIFGTNKAVTSRQERLAICSIASQMNLDSGDVKLNGIFESSNHQARQGGSKSTHLVVLGEDIYHGQELIRALKKAGYQATFICVEKPNLKKYLETGVFDIMLASENARLDDSSSLLDSISQFPLCSNPGFFKTASAMAKEETLTPLMRQVIDTIVMDLDVSAMPLFYHHEGQEKVKRSLWGNLDSLVNSNDLRYIYRLE